VIQINKFDYMLKSLLLLLFIVGFIENSQTQTLVRSVIGSAGNSTINSEIRVQQSIGQPSNVTNEKTDQLFISQGFLKSSLLRVSAQDLILSLYPNPNNGEFSFFLNLDSDESFKYTLTDAAGKLVLSGDSSGSTLIQINEKNLLTGMYFINVYSQKGMLTAKVNKIL
jgi:hypothetical protein